MFAHNIVLNIALENEKIRKICSFFPIVYTQSLTQPTNFISKPKNKNNRRARYIYIYICMLVTRTPVPLAYKFTQ
jgi:hypothetical protein